MNDSMQQPRSIKSLAIVGATGAVGREACRILQQHHIAVDHLKLLASPRSAGTAVDVGGHSHKVEALSEASFNGIQYAIFSAGGAISREYAPIAVKAGCIVVDNSSVFRMDPDTPLVIPEINPDDIADHQGIIANPNCSTIIAAMVVWPLHRVNPIKRMIISTYQSASGAGAAAMEELKTQSADVLSGRDVTPSVFPHPIAFNLFVHDSPLDEHGYNNEESKMVHETRKIFHAPDMPITTTCIRVPVMRAHSESINLEFTNPITPDEVRKILHEAPGVSVVDIGTNQHKSTDAEHAGNHQPARFPMPIDASEHDDCLVGHIRQDMSRSNGRAINMFVCGDQLRKGAALNAIQIIDAMNQ